MVKIDVEIYYNLVVKNRVDLLVDMNPSLPQTILDMAIEDFEFDVVRILLDDGYKANYIPVFKNKIIKYDNMIGFKHVCDEKTESLMLKFKMIELLLDYNLVDMRVIPNYLKEKWNEFKNC